MIARRLLLLLGLCGLAACTATSGPTGGPVYTLPGTGTVTPGHKADAKVGDAPSAAEAGDPAADGAAAGDQALDPGLDAVNGGEIGLGDDLDALQDPALAVDKDGDGVTPAQGDCDDDDKAVFPGAEETCNLGDDDCDGQIDELDGDGDGYTTCPGAQQDCDDADPTVHPKAAPDCSTGLDHDCDGQIDGQQDDDQDGHFACVDCDDKDPAVHPGAEPKCTNTKDNNCDGVIDAVQDADGDGWPACKDCDDARPEAYPGAVEICDGKDEDCNGVPDDKDQDGDGWSGCSDDCDDNDITVNPIAARNCKNGKDNDCNGVADAAEDGDKDGYSGCNDCNDYNPFINPNSLEYGADLIDNDCDGTTDEAPVKCDKAGLISSKDADYAPAIDLCQGVVSSSFATLAAPAARAIKTSYGPPNTPHSGPNFVVISSGNAAAKGDANYVSPQSGTTFSNSKPYPAVKCKNSGTVYDYSEWKIVLKVPSNAQAFSFDFNFMSAEYPEYVDTQFDDKFLAVLESQKFNGNISFDSKGSCISINSALFTMCTSCPASKPNCNCQGDATLQGTGYESGIGGGTGWLTTSSPVTPGETITLKFIVFDEGDHILDSVVILDSFRWHAKSATNTPSTVRPGG